MSLNEKKLRNFIILPALLVGLVFMSGCNIIPSERSNFCKTCHRTKGVFKNYDESSRFHEDFRLGKRDCINCHFNKSLSGMIEIGIGNIEQFVINFTSNNIYAPPITGGSYSDDDCLFCHGNSPKVGEMPQLFLPEKLKRIGLKYDHRIHMDLRIFLSDKKERLKSLEEKKDLSEEEKKELEFLKKAEVLNCSDCHDRLKIDVNGKEYIDKNVNYVAYNPMVCTGCHQEIYPLNHPGKRISKIPSEELCRRCHDGRLHGRGRLIFLVDCEKDNNPKNCLKCHPKYSPEKVVGFYRREKGETSNNR